MRYYEEIGLVKPSARTEGGFRLYSEEDVERLVIVKPMKPLGFSLDEMGAFLGLIEAGGHPDELDPPRLAAVVAALRSHAERTDHQIEKLERQLRESHGLRLRVAESLARCEAVLRAKSSGS